VAVVLAGVSLVGPEAKGRHLSDTPDIEPQPISTK